MGAFAEFERALILERQREGIAAAKQRGSYTCRKPALTTEQAQQLRERAAAGEKESSLAREFGISRKAVYSYLRPAAITGCPTPAHPIQLGGSRPERRHTRNRCQKSSPDRLPERQVVKRLLERRAGQDPAAWNRRSA
ncbi:helix-turn-helix domain-containing protein [Actinoplanes regularis]